MKTLFALAAVAALGGCAVAPAPYYASVPVSDPYQWHTVSVAQAPAGAPVSSGSAVAYASEPAYTTTAVVPVYAPAPVYYSPAPAYYYPPVSIGLDFGFGWCCGGHRWGGRGYYRHR